MLRQERQQGFASRSFTLACPVDESKAVAACKGGVLGLRLPKKASTSSRRLEIK